MKASPEIAQHIKNMENGIDLPFGRSSVPKDYYRQVKQKIKMVKGVVYRQPVVINDWGYNAFFTQAIESGWGTRGVSEQLESERLRSGTVVEVCWDDGKRTKHTLVGETITESVSEQGSSRPYFVESELLFIEQEVHGRKFRLPVQDVLLRIVSNVVVPLRKPIVKAKKK